jgi:hypothetical protein
VCMCVCRGVVEGGRGNEGGREGGREGGGGGGREGCSSLLATALGALPSSTSHSPAVQCDLHVCRDRQKILLTEEGFQFLPSRFTPFLDANPKFSVNFGFVPKKKHQPKNALAGFPAHIYIYIHIHTHTHTAYPSESMRHWGRRAQGLEFKI